MSFYIPTKLCREDYVSPERLEELIKENRHEEMLELAGSFQNLLRQVDEETEAVQRELEEKLILMLRNRDYIGIADFTSDDAKMAMRFASRISEKAEAYDIPVYVGNTRGFPQNAKSIISLLSLAMMHNKPFYVLAQGTTEKSRQIAKEFAGYINSLVI